MATYGEIRLRLVKAFPSIDPDLIDGWLDDRYLAILDRLAWTRQRAEAQLVATAPYRDGTVELTFGSAAVTGTDTLWTSAHTGMAFQPAGREEWYTFTRTGDTTGTLDRPYEGGDDPAAAYAIFPRFLALPADCAIVDSLGRPGLGNLDRLGPDELRDTSAGRLRLGSSYAWALAHDDASDPPRMQVELYPIPDQALVFALDYWLDATPLSAGQTSAAILPWVRPAAIVAGVTADCRDHLGEDAGYRRAESKFDALVSEMSANEARRTGPVQLKMSPAYTDHRVRRLMR